MTENMASHYNRQLYLNIVFFTVVFLIALLAWCFDALADTTNTLVKVDTASGNTGSTVEVNIHMKNPSGIACGQFDLLYDPVVAEVTNVANADLSHKLLIMANLNEAPAGKATIAWIALNEDIDDLTVLKIAFRLKGKSQTDIIIKELLLYDKHGTYLPVMVPNGTITVIDGDGQQDTAPQKQPEESNTRSTQTGISDQSGQFPGTNKLSEQETAQSTEVSKNILLTVGNSKALVNNQEFNLDVAPNIDPVSRRTLVPLRFVSEILGAKVNWIPEARQVKVADKDKEVVLTIGQETVSINGKKEIIDCTAIIVRNRTLVPLRFTSEYLGASVHWDEEHQTIHIKK